MKTIINSIALGSVTSLMAVCPSGACGNMGYYQNQPSQGYYQNQPGQGYYQNQPGQDNFYRNQQGMGYYRTTPESQNPQYQRDSSGRDNYYYQDQERSSNPTNPQNRNWGQPSSQNMMRKNMSKQTANMNRDWRSYMTLGGTDSQGRDPQGTQGSQGTDRQGTTSQGSDPYDRFDRSSGQEDDQDQPLYRGSQEKSQMNPQGYNPRWSSNYRRAISDSAMDMKASKATQDSAANETDKQLNERIRERLSNAKIQGYDTLILRTNNGIVVISGEVATPQDVQKITERLRNLNGLKALKNQATANKPQSTGTSPSSY